MRFYKGYVIGFKTAVNPVGDVGYKVIDVRDAKGRQGIIKIGYDRDRTLSLGSIIVISRKVKDVWKKKIYKIKFTREDGKYVFDLPEFLSSLNIKYKLYKRYDPYKENCEGGYETIICARGDISMGSDWCIDYTEYWDSVSFNEKRYSIKINGKQVSYINNRRLTSQNDKAIEWYKSILEKGSECDFSYEELGRIFDELGIKKSYSFLEIRFWDGELLSGNQIWK